MKEEGGREATYGGRDDASKEFCGYILLYFF